MIEKNPFGRIAYLEKALKRKIDYNDGIGFHKEEEEREESLIQISDRFVRENKNLLGFFAKVVHLIIDVVRYFNK